jgi:hypothetical protein
MRPRLHYLLIFSLLLISWLQLSHQTDLHAHENNGSCEICLFAGALGNGVKPASITTPTLQFDYYFRLPAYASPRLIQISLITPRLRGPPSLSLA